jgi:hypothetical protein
VPPVPPEIIEASYRGVNEQGCGSGSVFGIRIQEAKMTRIRIGLQHKTLDPDTEKMNTDTTLRNSYNKVRLLHLCHACGVGSRISHPGSKNSNKRER